MIVHHCNHHHHHQETPKFGGEESQADVQDKLQHMRSMMTYLEASRSMMTLMMMMMTYLETSLWLLVKLMEIIHTKSYHYQHSPQVQGPEHYDGCRGSPKSCSSCLLLYRLQQGQARLHTGLIMIIKLKRTKKAKNLFFSQASLRLPSWVKVDPLPPTPESDLLPAGD